MVQSRKRWREEDEDQLWQSESTAKRSRALPFRTSPTVKHTLLFSQSPRNLSKPFLTPNITPIESSEDEEEQPRPYSYINPPSAQYPSQLAMTSSPIRDINLDPDMIMVDSMPSGCPEASSTCLIRQPACLALHQASLRGTTSTSSGGRISTPRWGHFRTIETSMNMLDTSETSPSLPCQKAQIEVDYSSFLRRKRLPSPIGEDDDMLSPTAVTGRRPDHSDAYCNQYPIYPSGVDVMEENTPLANIRFTEPNTNRTMLSMGYRADCEKCRTRVPGHYNHVIRTC